VLEFSVLWKFCSLPEYKRKTTHTAKFIKRKKKFATIIRREEVTDGLFTFSRSLVLITVVNNKNILF